MKRRILKRILSLALTGLSFFQVQATVFTVSNTADAGAGSLRQAIVNANVGGAGPHSIQFSVSGTINLASALPAITNAGVTVDGGGNIVVSANVADVVRDIFTISANNTTLTGMALQNTGSNAVTVNGVRSGVTLQDLVIRNTVNDWTNHGIYVASTSTNMTIRDVTMTDIQDAYWGIRFVGAVTGLMIDGYHISTGSGNAARGIQVQGVATNVTIKNSLIDMDDPATTDDGDYGIYFNTTVNGLIIDSTTVHDAEIYPLFIGGAATNIRVSNSTIANLDGYTTTQLMRFNSTATRVYISNSSFNGDLRNTTNDADYGIIFVGNAQRVLINNNTFNEIDYRALQLSDLNNDSVIVDANTFTNNGVGGGYGTIEFYGVRTTTSDAMPVVISNNTIDGTNGIPVYLRPGDGGNYTVANLTVRNNTITNTKSRQGAIQINYIDKVNVTQNSIYDIQGIALDLAGAANCGYEGTNKPQLISSTELSPGTYNLQLKMPAVCGTGNCSVEVFATEAGRRGVGGQHYVTTLTNVPSGTSTRTVTGSFPEMTTAPYGVFTATMKVTTNNCGTSEYSNKVGIKPNGPAGVDQGIQVWHNPNILEDGNLVASEGWEDFSGMQRNFDVVVSDPQKVNGGLNTNNYVSFDGDDYLRSSSSPVVNTMTAGEVITVTRSNKATNVNNGNPYDYGSNSRASHLTWSNANIYNGFGTNDRLGWHPVTKTIVDAKAGVSAISGSTVNVNNWNIYGTRSGAGQWGVDFNGGQQTISTNTNTVSFALTTGYEHLGAVSGTIFQGDIAEDALWNRVLTAKERQRVNSYLAVKYGLTLNQNYLASDSVTIWWDRTVNTGYNNDMAGLARDNRSVLHQKQSKSINTDDVVTIGVGNALVSSLEDHMGNIANNLSALVWGNNDSATTYTRSYVTTYSDARMPRAWKVQKTGWSDTTVIIKLKGGNANRVLLVSTDPAFPVGSTTSYPLNDTGAAVLSSSILANGVYFSFANKIVAPACVTANIQGWYRADDPNADVDAWTDYSGYDRHATQAVVANQPVRVSNSTNFNPAFNFDGSVDYMDIAHNLGITGTTPLTVFAVGKRETTGSVDAFLSQQGVVTNNFLQYWTNTNKAAIGATNVGGVATTGTYATANIPYLVTSSRTGNNFSMYTNGVADGTGTATWTFPATNMRIGNRGASGDAAFDGPIAEIIVYNRALSAMELQSVHSYLSLKYGFTFNGGTQDYLASDGSKMWDAVVNAGYNFNIAGLGRDSICSNLHQKQGRSVNTGTLVTLALGDHVDTINTANGNSITNNLSFLTWGDNNGTTTFTQNVSGVNSTLRMSRVWKADKTNWADQFITVAFSGNKINTYLLISSDPAFATIDQEIALDADGNAIFNSSLLPDGTYFTFAKAINGPGNVDNGIVTWVRADHNVTDDGAGSASEWADFSGVGNDFAQATAAQRPAIVSNSIPANYNPTLSFSSSAISNLVSASNIWTAGQPGSAFAAAYHSSLTSAWSHLIDQSSDNPSLVKWNGTAAMGVYDVGVTTNGVTTPVLPTLQSNITGILGMDFGTTANSYNLYVNGMSGAVTHAAVPSVTSSVMKIGAENNNTEGWQGAIHEVVIYNRELNASEILKVNSYLALKYGVTLNQATPNDYLASDSTVIWDATTNSSYKYRITGIGRDDNSSLDQKQSRNVDTTSPGYVTMGLGIVDATNAANQAIFDEDRNFLVWGDDNVAGVTGSTVTGDGVIDFTTSNSCVLLRRMAKTYKVQETGNVGAVQVKVNLAGFSLANTAAELYLAINATNTFTGTITQLVQAASFAGNVATFDNVDLSDGQYFTVLGQKVDAPASVGNGLKMWLKASDGVTLNGSTVSQWSDQSITGYNVSQATAANQPAYTSNSVNFNPALSFDGTNDELTNLTRLYSDTNAFHLFAVSKDNRTVFTQTRCPLGIGSDGNYPTMDFQTDATSPLGFNPSMTSSTPTDWGTSVGLPRVDGKTNITMMASTNASLTATNNILAGVNGKDTMTTLDAKRQVQIGNGVHVGSSGDALWLGYIPEVIIYNRTLTAGEEQKINSYLAVKYGVSLDQTLPYSYISSDSTVIWDAVANNSYKYRITGIGRDICAALEQKQSRNQDTTSPGYVTMGLGSIAVSNDDNAGNFAADKNFLFWADDNVSGLSTATITGDGNTVLNNVQACTPLRRIAKTFRVQETGTVGNVQIQVNVKGLPLGQLSDIYLAINSSSAFSGTISKLVPATSLAGNVLIFDNVDFSNGEYFTVIGKKVEVPARVSGGLRTWLKADEGVDTTGSVVDQWNDQGLANINAVQTTGGAQPTWVSGMNYNPAVAFDGTNDQMDLGLNINASVSDSITVFTVYNAETAARGLWGNDNSGFDRYLFMNAYASGSANTAYTGGNTTGKGLLATAQYDEGQANGSFIWVNGVQAANFTQSGSDGGASNTSLGVVTPVSGTNFFDGNISEFIVYNKVLSPGERRKIESYLGIKYGITLNNGTTDYLASDSSVIWSAAGNAGYASRITGIGSDLCSELNQKQSATTDTAGAVMLQLSLGTLAADNAANAAAFDADLNFVVVADNDAARTEQTTDLPAAFVTGSKRLAREWKADVTGTAPTNLQLQIDLSKVGGLSAGTVVDDLLLLIDEDGDGDFTTGTVTQAPAASWSGLVATFNDVTLNDQAVFTVLTLPEPVKITARVFLQGAYNAGSMTTALKTASLLPDTDPYGLGIAPSVSPNAAAAAVVDWVLVELRDPVSPSFVVTSKAGLLLGNGNIVDTNYTQPLRIKAPNGNYKVAVKHRNHLGIMTLNDISFTSTGSATIDFADGTTPLYGTHAQKVIAAGVSGMWAGKVTSDGNLYYTAGPSDAYQVMNMVVNDAGNASHAQNYTGVTGQYAPEDVNLDGNVYYNSAPSDVNIIKDNVVNYPTNTLHSPSYLKAKEQLP